MVTKDLCQIVGKTVLRTPLGGEYRSVLQLLPGAVAEIQHKIAVAERKAGQGARRRVSGRSDKPDIHLQS